MINGLEKLFETFLQSTGVTLDTRNIAGGEIFFALKGEKVDGNTLTAQALEKGVICCVVDDPKYNVSDKCFVVEDSLIALQELAKLYRSKFHFPVLALTGSNGKTTTKELIAAVLSTKYKTYATKGNLNNHIGVPLTLLSIKNDCEFAVIEMGANHLKEIEFLCSLADPDYGLITNIGKAHLEGFGSLDGVKKGKSELYTYIINNGGVIFANSKQTTLDDVYFNYEKVIKYGYDKIDFLNGKIIDGFDCANVEIDSEIIINSHLVGSYNADNILAAACIGKYFKIGYDDIKSAIDNYLPDNNRSELRKIGDNVFILDAYNANPSSLTAALINFSKIKAENKIVIIGDMLELGEYAYDEHKTILDLAKQFKFDLLITVGPEFMEQAPDSQIQFINSDDAKIWFDEQQFKGATILLKGSRGMKLEKLIQ